MRGDLSGGGQEHGVTAGPPRETPSVDTPSASPASVVRGGFTPFVVGDAGRAAALVRPVPDPAEWHHPDTIVDGVVISDSAGRPAVELRAASIRGLSHRHYGKVRQDHYAFCATPDGRYLVVVVSDGVSEATHSHDAAKAVCNDGCRLLLGQLDELGPEKLDWQQLVSQLADVLVTRSAELGSADRSTLSPADAAATHAATALFAVVGLGPGGEGLPVQVFGIGDSPAWVLRGGTEWWPLQVIKNEGAVVASSRTRALPLPGTDLDPPVETTLGAADVLVVMTDGIADPLGDGHGDVGRFLADVWAQPPAPLAFAAHADFARKSHDDDRTVVAIWPEAGDR